MPNFIIFQLVFFIAERNGDCYSKSNETLNRKGVVMQEDSLDFTKRTVFITGAASGMGDCAARAFAARGAAAVLADVNLERAEAIAFEIRAAGGKALAQKVDVRSYEQIENAVKTAEKEFGSVDVTISFAGGEPGRMLNGSRDFASQGTDIIDWGIEVNGRAPVYLARAVIGGMMARRRGVIINIGSIDGVTGGALVYSFAKSGLIGFTKSLARYGAPAGVRCNCVSPGPVLTRAAMAGMKTALGRAAEPKEVVDLILYLASDKAAFITGCNYLIDGGRACLYS